MWVSLNHVIYELPRTCISIKPLVERSSERPESGDVFLVRGVYLARFQSLKSIHMPNCVYSSFLGKTDELGP